MPYKVTYKPYGESAILVEWPQEINPDILSDVLRFKEKLNKTKPKPFVYIKTAYCSLLIFYESLVLNFNKEIACIDKIYNAPNIEFEIMPRLWRVPVCYNASFGVDLEYISKEKNILKEEIIALHTQSIYTVYFIGFLPGFLYLGGLNETLQIPRKSTPRLQVEKGAVAIGGNQTGVYPNTSPGGWQIIGNSPLNFFEASKQAPCFAKAGDRIQFYSISLKKHRDIKMLVDAGIYQIESEVLDD